MKVPAPGPDPAYSDFDRLSEAEWSSARPRAPRIIYPPVSGRGPDDWFPDEGTDRAAPSEAPTTADAEPLAPRQSRPAARRGPNHRARPAKPAADRPAGRPRQPAPHPPTAAGAAAIEPRAWFDEEIDRGLPVPTVRRRRRWLLPSAAVFVVALAGAAALQRDGAPAELSPLRERARDAVDTLAALIPAPVARESGAAASSAAGAPRRDTEAPAELPPAESESSTAADRAEAPPRPKPAEIDTSDRQAEPAAALGEAVARTEPTTGRTAITAPPRRAQTAPPQQARSESLPRPSPAAQRPGAGPGAAPIVPPPLLETPSASAPELARLTLPAAAPVTAPLAPATRPDPEPVTRSEAPPPTRPEAPPAAPSERSPGTAPRENTAASTAPPVPRAEVDQAAVRSVLSRYQSAYTQLDANAAAAVYPDIDRRALARAFGALEAQRVELGQCDIQLADARARASCAGVASWVPKVGGGRREQARQWDFALRQVAGVWTIDTVRIR